MRMAGSGNKGGLSADDLALISAVIVVIGDLIALWAVIAARNEDQGTSGGAADNGAAVQTGGRRRGAGRNA